MACRVMAGGGHWKRWLDGGDFHILGRPWAVAACSASRVDLSVRELYGGCFVESKKSGHSLGWSHVLVGAVGFGRALALVCCTDTDKPRHAGGHELAQLLVGQRNGCVSRSGDHDSTVDFERTAGGNPPGGCESAKSNHGYQSF